MKSKKIISFLLISALFLNCLYLGDITVKAEEKATYVENICVSDAISIDADKITYDGTSYSKDSFQNKIEKENNIGNRDNFILQNYFIKNTVDEEDNINLDNQEKIENTKFSDTDVDIQNVKFLNADIGAFKNIQIAGEDIASEKYYSV